MEPVQLVVFVVTALALGVSVGYTLRWFTRTSARPAGAEKDAQPPAESVHHPLSPHDQATNQLLKQFFDGKACAICERPIPVIQRTGLKPGLYHPATHDTYTWDEIPNDNLTSTLETHLPLCSGCLVAESFRHRFPDLVLDRDRTGEHAQAPAPAAQTPPQNRIAAGS